MFAETIFPHFGVPQMVISDGGSHFIDRKFQHFLHNHGVRHNVATPYHPQTKWASRNIKQANQEHSAKDCQRDGDSLEG
jgi:hypothetical protein